MHRFLLSLTHLCTLLSSKTPNKVARLPLAKTKAGKLTSAPQTAITGSKGEEAAAIFVQALGWHIINRNWRHGSLELDIVAQHNDTLVFVEVKTRRAGGMSSPLDALTRTKQERLIRAALHWIAAHDAWAKPCRFDLAAVTAQDGIFNTELFQNVIELGDSNFFLHKSGRTSGGGYSPWQPW